MHNVIRFVLLVTGLALGAAHTQAQSWSCQDKGFMGSDSQVIGTLAGAAPGGLLGSQIGVG